MFTNITHKIVVHNRYVFVEYNSKDFIVIYHIQNEAEIWQEQGSMKNMLFHIDVF